MPVLKSALAAALIFNIGLAHAAYTPGALRARGFTLANIVLYDAGTASITVMGEITPKMVDIFRERVLQHPNIKQVFIDSTGGAVSSAIDLARIIYDRNLPLVVDGRCLSACANFIFAAARRKSVLTGSMVGIHETTVSYEDKNKKGIRKSTSGHEADNVLRSALSSEHLKELVELQRQEQNFYRDFGIKKDLYAAFANYISNRKASLGSDNAHAFPGHPLCPRLRFWVLSREQLVDMGVKGIDRFWFPQNELEKQRLYKPFGLASDSLYFGTPRALQEYCTGFAGSSLVRHWYALHSLISDW